MTTFADLPESFQHDCELAWNLREMLAEDGAGMTPMTSFFGPGPEGEDYGSMPLLVTHAAKSSLPMAIHAVRLGLQPLQADCVVVHYDATQASINISPLTGQPWQHGEMEKAHIEDRLDDILVDCIVSTASWPDGRAIRYTRPYRFEGNAVVWLDKEARALDTAQGDLLFGGTPDALRDSWDSPKFTGDFFEAFELPATEDPMQAFAQRLAVATYLLTISHVSLGVVSAVPAGFTGLFAKEVLAQKAMTPLGLSAYSAGVAAGYIEKPLPEMLLMLAVENAISSLGN